MASCQGDPDTATWAYLLFADVASADRFFQGLETLLRDCPDLRERATDAPSRQDRGNSWRYELRSNARAKKADAPSLEAIVRLPPEDLVLLTLKVAQ